MPGLGAVTGPLGSAGSSQSVTPGSGAKSWRVLDQTASNFPMSEFDDNGKLWITADAGDSAQNINLVNRTTTKTASGGTAWYRPQIGFWVKRPGDSAPLMRWQAPALDVTSGVAGSDADPRSDMVLAYRRDLVNAGDSADVIYIVDEPAGRIGVHHNVPRGTWHIGHRVGTNKTGALILENLLPANAAAWMTRWEEAGSLRGGVYSAPGTALPLGIRIGTSTPSFEVDITGTVSADFLRVGNTTSAWQNPTSPRLFGTLNPGSGVYPFNTNGNLVLMPRAENGGVGADVVIASGNAATPNRIATFVGNTTGGPNVVLFGQLPTELGGGKGVLGLGNVTTFPTTNPANGGIVCQSSGALNWVNVNGERVALGQVGPASEVGIRVGVTRGLDTRMYRAAAGRWATDSEFMFAANVGFYNTTPVAKQTVAAAATDAATTQTLANSLRSALIAYGLAA